MDAAQQVSGAASRRLVGQPGWACGHTPASPVLSPWMELGVVVCVSPSHVCRLRAPRMLKALASVSTMDTGARSFLRAVG